VDFRRWFQFQAVPGLATQPTLAGYRHHLVNLWGFHLRQQRYRTKTAVGADLVRGAVDVGRPFSVVVFESWFLPNELIDAIEAVPTDWIGGCPKDRLMLIDHQWVHLQAYLATIPPPADRLTRIHAHAYWAFTKVLTFKSLRRRRIRMVASFDNPELKGEPRWLTTNRKDWKPTRILLTSSDRWPTATFNEDVKGHLGFEDDQRHKLRGIRRHWSLCLAVSSLLSDQGPPGRARHGVRAPFESTGQRCRAVAHEVLGHPVEWIAQRLEEGLPATTIVQTLLA